MFQHGASLVAINSAFLILVRVIHWSLVDSYYKASYGLPKNAKVSVGHRTGNHNSTAILGVKAILTARYV